MKLKLTNDIIIEYIKSKKRKYVGVGVYAFAVWLIGLISMIRVPTSHRLESWIILLCMNIGVTVVAMIQDGKRTMFYQNLYETLFLFDLFVIFQMIIYNGVSFILMIDSTFMVYLIVSDIVFAGVNIYFILNKIALSNLEEKSKKNSFLIRVGTSIALLAYPSTRVMIKVLNSDQNNSIILFILFILSFIILRDCMKTLILVLFQNKVGFDEIMELHEKYNS